MLQALQECLERQELETGGSQFKRQGQAIQTPADLRDQRGGDGRQLKRGLDLPCPLPQECHGSIVSQRLVVGKVFWIRQSQRLDDKLAFALDTQHLPARHEQLQARTCSEQFQQARCCCNHGLEVVQHKQPVLLLQRGGEQLEWQAGAGALQTLSLCDSGQDQVGIVKGDERDEADSIGERIPQCGRDGQRQARLAHASSACQGEQTHLWTREQGTGGGNL